MQAHVEVKQEAIQPVEEKKSAPVEESKGQGANIEEEKKSVRKPQSAMGKKKEKLLAVA